MIAIIAAAPRRGLDPLAAACCELKTYLDCNDTACHARVAT